MKNKRIVASLNKVQVPTDRKEAMLNSILAQVDAQAASSEKEQEMNQNTFEKNHRSIKRRTLVVLIAAIIFLLCVGTAVAMYYSSLERAKDTTSEQSNLPQDAVTQIAEDVLRQEVKQDIALADHVIIPVAGNAKMQNATLTLTGLEQVFGYNNAKEIALTYAYVHFKVDCPDVGFVVSLDNDEIAAVSDASSLCVLGKDSAGFSLTADGKDCPIYQSKTTNEPPVYHTEQDGFSVRFQPDKPIPAGTPLCFTGTLCAYDKAGNVLYEIGSFSIPFSYSMEDFETAIQRKIGQYSDVVTDDYEQNAAVMATLPDNASNVGLTMDDLTIEDVAWRDDRLYLGFRWSITNEGLITQIVNTYIDGYLVPNGTIGDLIWETPALAGPPSMTGGSRANDVNAYQPTTALDIRHAKIPFAPNELPTVSTIHVQRRSWPGGRAFVDIDFVFRYHWETGEVTLPKDDIQVQDWLAEQKQAENDGRNTGRDYATEASATIAGTTISIRSLRFAADGTLQVDYHVENVVCETMAWETQPVITINGRVAGAVLPAPDGRDGFQVNIGEFVQGRELKKDRFMNSEWYAYPLQRIAQMPDTFHVDISFDLYDLSLNGKREFVGTFQFSIPVAKGNYLNNTDTKG